MSEELDDMTYNQILRLSNEAEALFEKKAFDQALQLYQKALDLIPNPKQKWEASLWVYTAIGDTYFLKAEFQNALKAFEDAKNCADGSLNPFINLRLGQCYFELKEVDKAEDYLLKAYMYEGESIFESENKKYFNHLKKKFDLN